MNYPNKIKKTGSKNIEYANRGMSLEYDLNITNQYYLDKNIAVIYKKPTPIKVVNVEYTNNDHEIKKAFFEKPSTTDYNGIYKGKYIDFEAKTTKNKTSFPLSNLPEFQLEHLKKVHLHGGIAFIIFYLEVKNEYYLYLVKDLVTYLDLTPRSSISFKEIEEKGYLIKRTINPPLDYLTVLDSLSLF